MVTGGPPSGDARESAVSLHPQRGEHPKPPPGRAPASSVPPNKATRARYPDETVTRRRPAFGGQPRGHARRRRPRWWSRRRASTMVTDDGRRRHVSGRWSTPLAGSDTDSAAHCRRHHVGGHPVPVQLHRHAAARTVSISVCTSSATAQARVRHHCRPSRAARRACDAARRGRCDWWSRSPATPSWLPRLGVDDVVRPCRTARR